jgi:sugar lactone lactonase YvrE
VRISRVETERCILGEGPVWDVAEQALYYLDIFGKKIHRYDPAKGTTKTWVTPERVGAIALREKGGAVVAMSNVAAALDFETGTFTPIASPPDQPKTALFNDGVVDKSGRFILGSCFLGFDDPQPVGGLYVFGTDHVFTRRDKDITYSNGPCLSPDNKTLYFSDSQIYACFAYDYDLAAGEVANKRLFAKTDDFGGQPDGATVDADGLIWMTIARAGKIVVFRPDGKVEREIRMPVSLAVSVMFGGPKLDQLYVTTIDPRAFNLPPEEGAGDVYLVEGLGARGLPEHRYAG